jgi:hypothetical protein
MALERKWDAVAPQAFIADGTPQGFITLADTQGFRTKQVAYLKSTSNPVAIPVQVKRVLSPTVLVVGAVDNKIASWTPFDVSAYTVASGAVIGAEEQNKNAIPRDDHYSSIYESDPVVADRTLSVDQYGRPYTPSNTLPVNIIPASGIPFSLGILALPTLVQQLVASLTFDQVTSSTVGNEETLSFSLQSNPITDITLTKTPDGWVLNIGSANESVLLLENGGYFELEDGSGAILLES